MSYDLIASPADVQPRFRRIVSALSIAMLTASTDDPSATTPLILWGSGVPAVAAPNGSVAFRQDGANASEVIYFRQGAAWVAAELDTGSGAIADAGGYYTTDTIDAAFDALALQLGGDTDATMAFTEKNIVADDDAVYAAIDALDVSAGGDVGDEGTIPTALLLLPNVVTDNDTVTIGADIYEWDDNASGLTVGTILVTFTGVGDQRTALITAINTLGTENVFASAAGTGVAVQLAASPGGAPTPGTESIVLDESITDAADVWNVDALTDMNDLGGRARGPRPQAVTTIPVDAAMIASGYVLSLPFTPVDFLVQVRNSGIVASGVAQGGDTFTIVGNGINMAFGGGVVGDAQVGDTVTVMAWGA